MYRVLMVDDDPDVLKMNSNYFKKLGYDVLCACNTKDALKITHTVQLDCVVLDIDMPGDDGFEACICLRETSMVPIVFLSGYGDYDYRIRAFRLGGDDFVVKPYCLEELELRVHNRIQRHLKQESSEVLCFSKLVLDSGTRTICFDGVTGDFSQLDFDILFFLAKHPNQVFSYEQLFDRVWHEPINEGRHTLQSRIAKVRQKLNRLCPGHEYIKTVRLKGYYFSP